MMKRFLFFLLLLSPLALFGAANGGDDARMTMIRGEITSKEDGKAVQYATIVEAKSGKGTVSDENGRFAIRIPQGETKLIISYLGYADHELPINTKAGERTTLKVSLSKSDIKIEDVIVKTESQSERINKMAFNVQALPIGDLKNTTATLSDALSKMNGIRIRETGGVGSETKISLDGFSDSHVKIFIDGTPMDSSNKSFSLSNIPANYAERIEVYNGVAPIEFGSDALGGVINIVTRDQHVTGWEADASYSYGSFNTHRSDLTFTHQLKNGLQYKVSAYQNYSDNNYKIDNKVFIYDGSSSTESKEVYTVERFHDTYHNESVIAELGVRRKKWADILSLSFNYSQYYREIQTGTKQDFVYGGRHREGYSLIPTLKFSKRDLFVKGLDLRANAAYNYGITTVVDTTVFAYNWFGETQYQGSNRTYTLTQRKDNSWSVNGVATYKANETQTLSLSYSVNASARVTRDAISGTSEYADFADPQYTTKSVAGLSYLYRPSKNFNIQGFGKTYMQSNDGKTYDNSGRGTEHNKKNTYFGYGAAATYHFLKGFQAKASYELAYRLPTTTELFGDSDLEIGSINLDPESSNNFNVGLSYSKSHKKHNIYLNGGAVYRMTKDYIIRTVSSDGETATYSNYGAILTKGGNIVPNSIELSVSSNNSNI